MRGGVLELCGDFSNSRAFAHFLGFWAILREVSKVIVTDFTGCPYQACLNREGVNKCLH